MKTKTKLKQFLKKYFPANPLSYLGWLGMLGVLGLLCSPIFIPFLLFFTFFSYCKVIADELFWKQAGRAAVRAFWSVFAFEVATAFVLLMRGMAASFSKDRHMIMTTFGEGAVNMDAFLFDQLSITFFVFFMGIILMILVFTISMMRFRRQEKKMLEEEEG